MAEAIVIFLIFAAVITITAIVFGGWLIIGIARMVFRMIAYVMGANTRPRMMPPPMPARGVALRGTYPAFCPNPQCLATNRGDARFCRRCGVVLPTPQQLHARRAAMWWHQGRA